MNLAVPEVEDWKSGQRISEMESYRRIVPDIRNCRGKGSYTSSMEAVWKDTEELNARWVEKVEIGPERGKVYGVSQSKSIEVFLKEKEGGGSGKFCSVTQV